MLLRSSIKQIRLAGRCFRYFFSTDASNVCCRSTHTAAPLRLLKVLDVEGENSGAGALRDVRGSGLLVSRRDFDAYIARSRAALSSPSIIVAEPNEIMAASYVLLDGA
jgi:hypothetical protein